VSAFNHSNIIAMLHPHVCNLPVDSIVRNDYVSKPMSKGILDGNLLRQFEVLSTARQEEITRQIGTEKNVILRDWISLGGAW
jgi:cleavage and polyadenylation specificity factor subunit 1